MKNGTKNEASSMNACWVKGLCNKSLLKNDTWCYLLPMGTMDIPADALAGLVDCHTNSDFVYIHFRVRYAGYDFC